MPFPITVAILPKLAYSKDAALALKNAGVCSILHQPMQAVNLSVDPGPGAIKPEMYSYEIEEIVNSYEGIKQSFAVQAGREVRVIVQSEMFDDLASQKLARDIAKKIEDELDYPGQIKVTVVREFRTTEIAK